MRKRAIVNKLYASYMGFPNRMGRNTFFGKLLRTSVTNKINGEMYNEPLVLPLRSYALDRSGFFIPIPDDFARPASV